MTNITKKLKIRDKIRQRRVGRVRVVVQGTAERPRLAVFRSLKHLSVQIINDDLGQTVLSVSDKEVDQKLRGVAQATAVGILIGERAKGKGIKSLVFDRRQYRYHGKVKAVAEAVRSVGLSL